MNNNNGLPLIAPQVTPPLDPWFRPAALANRAFRQQVRNSGQAVPLSVALEQADGNVSRFSTEVFAETSRSGWKFHLCRADPEVVVVVARRIPLSLSRPTGAGAQAIALLP